MTPLVHLRYLIVPDPSVPVLGHSYIRRIRRKIFWQGAAIAAGFLIITGGLTRFATIIPTLQTTFISSAIPYVIAATLLSAGISMVVFSLAVPYGTVHRAIGDWRQQLLPEYIQAGESVAGLLTLPAQSYLLGNVVGVFAAGATALAFDPAFRENCVEIFRESQGNYHIAIPVTAGMSYIALHSAVMNAWFTIVSAACTGSFPRFVMRFLLWSLQFYMVAFLCCFVLIAMWGTSLEVIMALKGRQSLDMHLFSAEWFVAATLGILGAITLRAIADRFLVKTYDWLRRWESEIVERADG